jgi:hypothetical protein
MEILTHPRELTRKNLEKWRNEFVKKLARTTTRTDLDRLILAVERREFENTWMAEWEDVVFEDIKGKVTRRNGSEEFEISDFERKILDHDKNLKPGKILRSDLKEENGAWKFDKSIKEISSGGEAVVLEEIIAGRKIAVRVQCFDSALFTGDMDEYEYEWHLSNGDFKDPPLFLTLFRFQNCRK